MTENPKTCRLLVVTDVFPTTPGEGAPRSLFVADVCTRLAQEGHVVSVLAPKVASNVRQARFPGIQVERFSWMGGEQEVFQGQLSRSRRWQLPPGLGTLMETGSYLRRGLELARQEAMRLYPHIALCMGNLPSGMFTRGLLDLFGVPYMVWALGDDLETYGYPWRRALIGQILAQATHIGADSKTLGDAISEAHGRECGFWPAAHAAPERVEPRGGPVRRFVCFCPKSVEGSRTAIEAFALAAPQMRRAELTLVGAGEGRGALMALAEGLRMAPRVRFVERPVSRREVRRLMAESDAVVVPGQRAALPHALVEAVGLCRPALVGDTGDMPGLVEELGVGAVFPAGSVAELSDALWSAYHQGLEVDEAAWGRGREALSLERSARALHSILEATVLGHRGRW